ncbi:hypothetical protein GCK72_016775 [Caenorhabditis remanei]|uniref:Sdz-33 F-box domain-containing protein n=1 Tax=Caenorhabditis remanei TaxID=31234 RepID=A0A6A5G5C8_CAERE|nr:hypothetical protein GCK72_016775 [Caenorhabditis remanei]KAF1750228.1 hypothetical protein GCK72_016775 [Caenorhabditis remanei]
MSQVSARTLNLLNLARIPVRKVHVVNGITDAIFVYEHGSFTKTEFLIHFLKNPQTIVGQIKTNNVSIDICEKDVRENIIRLNSNQFGYGLIHVLTHLDKIFFRIDIAMGIEHTTLVSMRGILCHSIFKKCGYLQFRGETETLSNEDCNYVLEKTEPTRGITIFCKLSSDFNYERILNFSRLRVPNVGNMTLQNLKNLDSEIANLGNHHFKEADINEFLHHWLKGNSRKLRRLKLDGFKEEPDWDALLKDISHKEWNETERGRHYKIKYTSEWETIDCKRGRDFKDKDGRLATVVNYSEFLDFLVWIDRFP